MLRKNRGNQRLPFGRQMHGYDPPVILAANPLHQTAFFKVINHQGHVAGAFQLLRADLAVRQRPQVIECFQHAELGDGQIALRPGRRQIRHHRICRTRQLDEGVQTTHFFFCALIMGRHNTSTSNYFICIYYLILSLLSTFAFSKPCTAPLL